MLASTGSEAPAEVWDAISGAVSPPPSSSARPVPLVPPEAKRRRSRTARRMRLPTAGGVLVGMAAAAAIAVLAVQVGNLNHRLNHVNAQASSISAAAQSALLDPQARRIVLSRTDAG